AGLVNAWAAVDRAAAPWLGSAPAGEGAYGWGDPYGISGSSGAGFEDWGAANGPTDPGQPDEGVQERGTTGEPATEPDAPSARPTSNQSGGDDMSTYGQEYGGQGYGDYGGQGSGGQQQYGGYGGYE